MSDYLLLKVADRVLQMVNSVNHVNFDSERRFPDFDLELKPGSSPVVDVVPAGIKAVDFTSRGTVNFRCAVDIVLRYRFMSHNEGDYQTGGPEVESVDQLVEQTEDFVTYFCGHRRIGSDQGFDAVFDGVEMKTTTDPAHIRIKQFTSITRVFYNVLKTIVQPE